LSPAFGTIWPQLLARLERLLFSDAAVLTVLPQGGLH